MPHMPVPGSEIFASRIRTKEQLQASLPETLLMHQATAEDIDAMDALSYEVIRHRLWAITDLMGQALKQMSGSLVVTDCNDFNVAIADEYGEIVQVGPYNTELAASTDLAIKWILENRSENPGIREGDMFLCNDPWVGGGLHQNDVALLAPLFHDGQLFAWTAAVAHQVDLGGVSPGSWTPRAQDIFWESLPTPPVKIVEDYVLRRDVEDLYVRRSRVPHLVALDLRAKIGSNNVGHKRIRELIAKYGAGMVKAAMAKQLDDAEQRLRAKLEKVDDGTWSAISYQDQSMLGDRGLHPIVCTLTKTGTELLFDFTGTGPQSGMINCTFSGMYGGVLSAVLPVLCGDIPWATGGIRRCITLKTEEGTLNNATFPTAVGKGSVASAWATTNAVVECLSKMLDTSVDLKHQVQSVCSGSWDLCVMAGLDQRSQPFATMLTDSMGGGFGAGIDHDGVDTGGLMLIPMGKMPDVEMNEFMLPMLYLWRREETDTGGPGRYRGGVTGSLCFVPHDTQVPLMQIISGAGKAVSQNVGMAGGYPGNTQLDIAVRESNVRELFARGVIPSTLEEIDGDSQTLACEAEAMLAPNDVHFMCWQSGGGYGDPLLREPERVAHDVAELRVSPHSARAIYGVALTEPDHQLDVPGTERLRAQMKQTRRDRSRAATTGKAVTA